MIVWGQVEPGRGSLKLIAGQRPISAMHTLFKNMIRILHCVQILDSPKIDSIVTEKG